ncbi:translesion DNA synthesis-associated protein ImuA [Paraburkholderia strydomiana]|uniref:translesion DNA synthesis-associated protein ImuA n=1 Tax=Paraburkholderia strydomiana TaxID=1245417 RepID=UPI0038BBF2D9
MTTVTPSPESIHPSLWLASQLAHGRGRVVETGYPALSAELPGGGWPVGALVDLLVQLPGVGEFRLLRPALSQTGSRPVAFVQPPHTPDGLGLAYIGLTLEQMLRVKAPKTADALWSVEQILRAGSYGALIFWTQYAQSSSLRRLHLAAQSSETLFVMVRPLAAAQDASPALLRLALKPSADGLTVDIVKRRGPSCTEPLAVALQPTPILLSRHARLSLGSPAEVATGSQWKVVLA